MIQDNFKLSMGKDGIERGFVWLYMRENSHGLANGKALSLSNNWVKNSYELKVIQYVGGYPDSESLIVVEKGKDEILSSKEFEDKYNFFKKQYHFA